jgi:hypothetical protein
MHYWQIDWPIMSPTFDENWNWTGYKPGCRVNIATEDMQPEWEEYQVHPVTPLRVWAGDEPPYTQTIFLLFESDEQMIEVLDLTYSRTVQVIR